MIDSVYFANAFPSGVGFVRSRPCRSSRKSVILHDFSRRPLPYNSVRRSIRSFYVLFPDLEKAEGIGAGNC